MYVRKPTSFETNRFPKNAGTIYFMCGGQYEVSKKGSQDGLRNGFLSSAKSGQWVIVRKDFIQADL
jgi:hypothetical protein